jgi:hypothetical protein
MPASSPSTVANSRDRRQPTAASTPSSRRRPRTAAVAALPTNNMHTTKIRVTSTRLCLSTAWMIASATPFFTQFSDKVSAGCPDLPAGMAIVTGVGEDPATMSTSRPVRCAICCATALIRARDSASAPVTPATRTRITLIGSAAGTPV